jgi:PrtD family type I secretion system ABC transporter
VGFSKFLRMFVQILILGVGAWLVLQSDLTAGGMIAASILLGRALAPIEQSIGVWKLLVAARDARDRLSALFARLPPEPQGMRLPTPCGRLSCEGVVYTPPGRAEPVLRGVSFAVEPGTGLGILGPSAAGKSTLCKILVGIWQPTRGSARLDGADLFAWSADLIGRHIGYLPQDVELFAGSVGDNIARLGFAPDPDAVVAAAQAAGMHDMILALPQGYDTEIGDAGGHLSGGQRQRIGLARALYGRPRVIVLDEPNACLDGDGETALLQALYTAKGWGATVVLVAHQPRILAPVDHLLLLRNGAVEAFGPRDEVLERLRPLRPLEAPARPSPVRAQVRATTPDQRELSHAAAR